MNSFENGGHWRFWIKSWGIKPLDVAGESFDPGVGAKGGIGGRGGEEEENLTASHETRPHPVF